MRVAILYKPMDMRIEEVKIPQIKPDEVLVKMKCVGICGSAYSLLSSWTHKLICCQETFDLRV